MSAPCTARAFLLRPIDTLFFRDGRPFGPSTVAGGGLPQPQTLSGAFRTHAMRVQQIDQPDPFTIELNVRGPWFCRLKNNSRIEPDSIELVFHSPADLAKKAKADLEEVLRYSVPRATASNGHGSAGLPRLRYTGDDQIEYLGGFITMGAMERYLEAGAQFNKDTIKADECLRTSCLYDFETRVGIGINPDSLAAEDSLIYSTRMLRLKPNVAFYAEVCWPMEHDKRANEALPADGAWTMPFGGEGKRVHVQALKNPVSWPKPKIDSERTLMLTIAPALFREPPYSHAAAREGWALRCAGVSGYQPVSGWDMKKRCPKPTRNFVNAGAVYFFEKRESWKESSDLQDALGECHDDLGGRVLLPQGYGLCLKGNWNYE